MDPDRPNADPPAGDVSMWTRYTPRTWALHWLRGQRELIVGAARDEEHARTWLGKEAKKATLQARRLMESPALAERQIVLAEIIRREILPRFADWYARRWEPADDEA